MLFLYIGTRRGDRSINCCGIDLYGSQLLLNCNWEREMLRTSVRLFSG